MEDKSLGTLIELALKSRFPNECARWEKRRKEIMQDFQGILTERLTAMSAKIEQDFEDVRVKIREAVVIEVLKAYP